MGSTGIRAYRLKCRPAVSLRMTLTERFFMKKITLSACALFSLFSAASAFGNDTSFPSIDVDGIDTNVSTKSYIKFEGSQVAELMSVLPSVSSVSSEKEKHMKSLIIRSFDHEVSIVCFDQVRPTCHIAFDRINSDFDTFPFKAKK